MYVLSSLETSEVSQDSTFVSCFTVLGMSCMCSGNNCQENESTYFTQVLFYIWFFLINTVNIIIFAPATDDFNVPSCFCVCFSIEYAVARKLYHLNFTFFQLFISFTYFPISLYNLFIYVRKIGIFFMVYVSNTFFSNLLLAFCFDL